jgi:uncharacterized protein with HEPN domain
MKRDDNVFIKHILDSAEKISAFIEGKTRSDLDIDEKLALALIRLLEIIGEAANSLSKEYQLKNMEVPWRKLIAMRNRLIHGYFDINHDIMAHSPE